MHSKQLVLVRNREENPLPEAQSHTRFKYLAPWLKYPRETHSCINHWVEPTTSC